MTPYTQRRHEMKRKWLRDNPTTYAWILAQPQQSFREWSREQRAIDMAEELRVSLPYAASTLVSDICFGMLVAARNMTKEEDHASHARARTLDLIAGLVRDGSVTREEIYDTLKLHDIQRHRDASPEST